MKIQLRHRAGRKVEYLSPEGKWKSTGKDNKRDAERWVIANSSPLKKNNIMGEFADKMFNDTSPGSYIDMCVKSGTMVAYSTWYTYKRDAILYILPYFKDMPIVDITPIIIQNWLMTMKGEKGELASTTKIRVSVSLSKIMEYAMFCGIIPDNPCKKVIGLRGKATRPKKPFTDEEMSRMFPDDDLKLVSIWGSRITACYFMILRDTGWRPGEAAALTPSCFIGHNGVYTTRSLDPKRPVINDRVKTSASGYSIRLGILSDRTMELVSSIIGSMEDDEIIFKTINGNYYNCNFNSKILSRVMKKVSIPKEGHCPYSFRVTFLTKKSQDYSDTLVMKLMGHTNWHACYDKRSPTELLDKLFKELADADSGRKSNGNPVSAEV